VAPSNSESPALLKKRGGTRTVASAGTDSAPRVKRKKKGGEKRKPGVGDSIKGKKNRLRFTKRLPDHRVGRKKKKRTNAR